METSLNILIVQPPIHLPGVLSEVTCRIAEVLKAHGVCTTIFDAAWDFVDNYLLASNTTKGERRIDPYNWSAPMPFEPELFLDPAKAAWALQQIDRTLAEFSTTIYPAHIDRRGFSCPGLDDAVELTRFVQDLNRNPFWDYANRHCPLPLTSDDCDLVLIALESHGQIASAATLAEAWQSQGLTSDIAACSIDPGLRQVAGTLFPPTSSTSRSNDADAVLRIVHSALDSRADSSSATVADVPCKEQPSPMDYLLEARGAIRRSPLQEDHLRRLLDREPQLTNRLVVWYDPKGELPIITRLLYQASRAGFWNHLVIEEARTDALTSKLAEFAAANPNIIHSWCWQKAPVSAYSDALHIYPLAPAPYGRTQSLAGTPLWQRLQDPVYLQAFVARSGAADLMRLHLSDKGHQIHRVGSQLVYHYMPPEELAPGYLDEICVMVEAGGSVNTKWVRHNLERAFLIAYVEENGAIVGNSSLKHPRKEYIAAVSQQSGIDLHSYLERGYTSVRPEYRSLGIGAKLLEGLTKRAEGYKIFSVIGEDNVATQKMAIRNRTRKVAVFFSERAGKQVGVWIPEWMIPEGVVLPPQPELDNR